MTATEQGVYALRLSADELERHRMMAARARAEEGDLWERPGWSPARGWPTSAAGRARCWPAWAARDELERAGSATGADVARWDAAFRALDSADVRPTLSLDVFAAVCRRPARARDRR